MRVKKLCLAMAICISTLWIACDSESGDMASALIEGLPEALPDYCHLQHVKS